MGQSAGDLGRGFGGISRAAYGKPKLKELYAKMSNRSPASANAAVFHTVLGITLDAAEEKLRAYVRTVH